MLTTHRAPNVFLLHLEPAPELTAEALQRALSQLGKRFVLTSHPQLAPELLAHRFLRDAANGLLWEIALDGFDIPASDTAGNESIAEAILNEATANLECLATIRSFAVYTDVSIPAAHVEPPIAEESDIASFGSSDEPHWREYAQDSGTALAGRELPASILEAIAKARAAAPSEPNLRPYGKGHVYFALEDRAHRAWLREFFEAKMAVASPADRRRIRAFSALQPREGTTASINTYDSQIVTWGSGWGGLGWLGNVMHRLSANAAVRMALENAGVRYRRSNTYDIVDLEKKRVITGRQEALEVMRASLPLLNLLIHLARSPETRQAVADAQLGTFLISAGDVSSAEVVATQALFNLVTHLKHWAPGYATGCLEWATARLPLEPPSEERDRRLAPLVGRYFYGKARGKAWIPDWKQFQSYWQHMKEDGLDCLNDPFIRASAAPTDDPFAQAAPAAPLVPAPIAAKPASILRSKLFAGREQLEAVAQGRAVLRRGAEGDAVKAMQEALVTLGFRLPAGVDGLFSPGLERAVRAFQKAHGLTDDGIIGPRTMRAMDAALGRT